jgi:protein-S-isoprenylcysteine O-methyltransferase Ste14
MVRGTFDPYDLLLVTAMRNPIRLKNVSFRFLPLFVVGVLVLVWIRPGPGEFAVGGGLVLSGALLRGWGAGHLVKNDRLTIAGPYAHMRHPLYAGTLLVAVGFSLIAGGKVAFALLAILFPWFFLVYFPRKDRIESARLERRYGTDFARYRDHVPALFPISSAWVPPKGVAPLDDPDRSWSGERYVDNNELGTLIALIAGLAVFGLRIQIGP